MDLDVSKLVTALDAMMNPNTPNSARSEALNYCNSFKSSDQCSLIGLKLVCQADLNDRAKYFGLELIKHRVKMAWMSMSIDEKTKVKDEVMQLIANLSPSHPRYFLNAFAAILTEFVKHTWPQAWPSMLDEVVERFVATGNLASTEVLLVTLLNLVEDVCLYGNVASASRLRDLKQAMAIATEQLVGVIVGVLDKNIADCKSPQVLHILQVTLATAAGYLEWVKVECVSARDYYLPMTLCSLLVYNELRVAAADCLLVIASRRGKASEKMEIVKLAEGAFVDKYKQAIEIVMKGEPDEDDVLFLSKLDVLLNKLIELVADLYNEQGSNDDECLKSLTNFEAIFELLFWFAKHESRMVSFKTMQSWLLLLRNDNLRSNKAIEHCAIALITTIAQRVTNESAIKTSMYVELEQTMKSDEDELKAFYKCHRLATSDLFRECVKKIPATAIQSCLDFGTAQLDVIRTRASHAKEELEVISFFFENGLPQAVQVMEDRKQVDQLPFAQAEQLLSSYLPLRVDDALCSQFLLIIVFKLTDMLCLSSNPKPYVQALIDYMFDTLRQSRTNIARDRAELRRHCCAVLIKISKQRAAVMAGFYELISARVNELMNHFSSYERTSMFEVQVMLASQFDDPALQKSVIVEAMRSCDRALNLSPAFAAACKSPESFVEACGFTRDRDDDEHTHARFRARLNYMLTTTCNVLRRVRDCGDRWSLPDEQMPAMGAELLKAVENSLVISYHLSSFWEPSIRQRVHADLAKALEARRPGKEDPGLSTALQYHDCDNNNNSALDWRRLQTFLFRNHEIAYMLLGAVGPVLKSNFYKLDCIGQVVHRNILAKIPHLPMGQLKPLMRQFLLDFIRACPLPYLESVALPILSEFCRFMIERLHPEWENFARGERDRLENAASGDVLRRMRDEVDVDDGEEVDDEVFREVTLRTASREYLDFLVSLSVNKTPPSKQAKLLLGGDSSSTTSPAESAANLLPVTQLTELGTRIAPTAAGMQMWNTALLALSWHDGATCCRAAQLLSPTLKLAFKTSTQPMPDATVRNLLEGVLRGLNRHGCNQQGEQALLPIAISVLTRFYESHRATLIAVLKMAVPGSDENVESFFLNFAGWSGKKRKTEFKKLIAPIVEQHVSQRFRDIPDMDRYAAINVLGKRQAARLNKTRHDDDEGVSGVALLFTPDSA